MYLYLCDEICTEYAAEAIVACREYVSVTLITVTYVVCITAWFYHRHQWQLVRIFFWGGGAN